MTFLNKFVLTAVFVLLLVFLIFHLLGFDFLVIDNITLLLLVFLLVIPFIPSVKRLKWGDIEAEIGMKEVEAIEKEAKQIFQKVDEIKKEETKEEDTNTTASLPKEPTEDYLLALFEFDPVTALTRLRIELESKLRRLVRSEKKIKFGIRPAAEVLLMQGIIDKELKSLISDIARILRRVAHGGKVSTDTAEKVLSIGIEILNTLDNIYFETFLKTKNAGALSQEEFEKILNAKFEVVTISPTDPPTTKRRTMTQQELDHFLTGYNDLEEILVEIRRIDS